MKRVAIISDTHGTFDVALREFLRDVDEVWHAGDVGGSATELADEIARYKPLRCVYGNIDGAQMRRAFPQFECFECERVRVLMTHIGGYPKRYETNSRLKIEQLRPKLFISGHSHILKVIYDPKYDLLHINPGAAGNYGIHKVRTAVRFTIDGDNIRDLEVGEWLRR
ncbi:MAG: metallophosphoesterase family protein [Rikenellaceae bacterium]